MSSCLATGRLVVLLVGLSLVLVVSSHIAAATPEKAAAKKKSKADDEEEDDFQYLGITKCSACENAVERIVATARTTPLGPTARSMHKTDKAVELKRTKLVRAHEIIDKACDAETRGPMFKATCQEALRRFDDDLVQLVLDRLDPLSIITPEQVKEAEDHGKHTICLPMCDYKMDIKRQLNDVSARAKQSALDDVMRQRNTLAGWLREIKDIVMEYWYLYAVTGGITFALSIYGTIRNRRLREAMLKERLTRKAAQAKSN